MTALTRTPPAAVPGVLASLCLLALLALLAVLALAFPGGALTLLGATLAYELLLPRLLRALTGGEVRS